jgi:hypothetical protein
MTYRIVAGVDGSEPGEATLSQRCAAGAACPVVLIKLPGERASGDAPA